MTVSAATGMPRNIIKNKQDIIARMIYRLSGLLLEYVRLIRLILLIGTKCIRVLFIVYLICPLSTFGSSMIIRCRYMSINIFIVKDML